MSTFFARFPEKFSEYRVSSKRRKAVENLLYEMLVLFHRNYCIFDNLAPEFRHISIFFLLTNLRGYIIIFYICDSCDFCFRREILRRTTCVFCTQTILTHLARLFILSRNIVKQLSIPRRHNAKASAMNRTRYQNFIQI